MRRHTGRVAFAAAWLLLMSSLSAAKVTVGMEDLGLGGSVKGGLWAPLYVELTSKGEDFEGAILVSVETDDNVQPLFVKRVVLPRDQRTRHWMYLRLAGTSFRREKRKVSWRVVDGRGRDAAPARPQRQMILPAWDTLVAAFRTANLSNAGLAALTDQESHAQVRVVFVSPQTAPDRAIGYESADVLVWLNPNPSMVPTVAQREAIADYVRRGGHLVVAAGAGWQALTEPFLADLLPARPVGSSTLADLPMLAAYGDPGQYGRFPPERRRTVLMELADVRGEALMEHAGRPVVVRGVAGLGRVTLVAFDPTTSPFKDLKRRARFWETILDVDRARYKPQEASGGVVSFPLIQPLNDFPGFKPINFVLVAFFLVAYVVIIGPVDYFVLKHFKKLHWTWVTFPSVAILSSVLAFYFLSSGTVVGLWSNSVSVVDAGADGEEIAGITFMTMLSPSQTRYTVDLEGAASGSIVPREFDPGVGGGGVGLGRSTCNVIGAGERIEGLRVRIWDAQTMRATWRVQAGDRDLPEVDLRAAGGALTGSVTNATDETMHEAVVIFSGRVASLGSIQPGKATQVGGRRWQTLSKYARGLTPSGFRQRDDYGWGGWGGREEDQIERTQADAAARWVSLFGSTAAGEGGPRFRRVMKADEPYRAAVFDLPAPVQLTGFNDRDRAVVMYSTERSFVSIRLAGRSPRSWDRSVVRLHVPLAP